MTFRVNHGGPIREKKETTRPKDQHRIDMGNTGMNTQ